MICRKPSRRCLPVRAPLVHRATSQIHPAWSRREIRLIDQAQSLETLTARIFAAIQHLQESRQSGIFGIVQPRIAMINGSH